MSISDMDSILLPLQDLLSVFGEVSVQIQGCNITQLQWDKKVFSHLSILSIGFGRKK